jgi:hypothetical protein
MSRRRLRETRLMMLHGHHHITNSISQLGTNMPGNIHQISYNTRALLRGETWDIYQDPHRVLTAVLAGVGGEFALPAKAHSERVNPLASGHDIYRRLEFFEKFWLERFG